MPQEIDTFTHRAHLDPPELEPWELETLFQINADYSVVKPSRARLQAREIFEALSQSNGNRAAAAKALGLSLATVKRALAEMPSIGAALPPRSGRPMSEDNGRPDLEAQRFGLVTCRCERCKGAGCRRCDARGFVDNLDARPSGRWALGADAEGLTEFSDLESLVQHLRRNASKLNESRAPQDPRPAVEACDLRGSTTLGVGDLEDALIDAIDAARG